MKSPRRSNQVEAPNDAIKTLLVKKRQNLTLHPRPLESLKGIRTRSQGRLFEGTDLQFVLEDLCESILEAFVVKHEPLEGFFFEDSGVCFSRKLESKKKPLKPEIGPFFEAHLNRPKEVHPSLAQSKPHKTIIMNRTSIPKVFK